jgi:hypothetical protein
LDEPRRSLEIFAVEVAGIEPDPSRSTNLDIITEVDAAAAFTNLNLATPLAL